MYMLATLDTNIVKRGSLSSRKVAEKHCMSNKGEIA
jgi:hypothetical protein